MRQTKYSPKLQLNGQNENFLNFLFQYQRRLSIYALQYCIKMARIEKIKNSHLGTFNVLVRYLLRLAEVNFSIFMV